MKILVTGSRNYTDRVRLYEVLDNIEPSSIVHGAARGADSLASEWAQANQIEEIPYPADWDRYGKSAGSRRNKLMLDSETDIELVVAFPLKNSIGTWHMVSLAKTCGVEIRIVS